MTVQNGIDANFQGITHATTFTWQAHTTGSFTFHLQRLGRDISIQMPIISITSTQNGFITSNTAIPSVYRPTVDVWNLNFCIIGGTAAKCLLICTTAGIIQFKTDADAAINSTSFAIRPPSIKFLIQT